MFLIFYQLILVHVVTRFCTTQGKYMDISCGINTGIAQFNVFYVMYQYFCIQYL